MAKGKSIVLTVEPKGNRIEGIAAEAILAGSMIAVDAAVEPISGRHSYNADTTAGVAIAYNSGLLGDINTDSVAIGERVFGYCPLPGDELNVLFLASEGAQAIGDVVGPSGAAGLFASAGTGWVCMETITVGATPTAGTLVHCMKL